MKITRFKDFTGQNRHYERRGRTTLRRSTLPKFLAAALVAYVFLSSSLRNWFVDKSQGGETKPYRSRISDSDLQYGLTQCARHGQRPTVDSNFAAKRLDTCPRVGVRTVLRNATLIDGNGKVRRGCHIEMQSSIFTQVDCSASSLPQNHGADNDENVKVIDLAGRVVTPGLIDVHSHAGVRETPQLWATEDVTEVSAPVTPWGRAIDALKPHDQAIPVIGSGGVTTSLVLTGAKNLISGEGVVIKMRRGNSIRDIAVNMTEGLGADAAAANKPRRFLKMAIGENQKRQFEHIPGGPATRIGESFWFRRSYENARQIKRQQDLWCEAAADASRSGEPNFFPTDEYPHSLEWQTLVDVLRGDMRVHVHGYETEDILALFDHADEFGFEIAALHHALHTDQITDEINRRNIAVVGFSDSWGDKKELYNVSSYLPKRIADKGIPFTLTRDHPAEHGQWLMYEGQIAHHFGLDAQHTIASVISEPARLLGLDNRIGFVRPGYDADLIIWDRHPLRVGATPLEVFIDGKSEVRASDHLWAESREATYNVEAPSARRDNEVRTSCQPGQSDIVIQGIDKSFVGDAGLRSEILDETKMTAVIRAGRVVCIGGNRCDEIVKKAADENVPFMTVQNGHILPGLTILTRQHGLVEMRQEPSTTDGASPGDDLEHPLSSQFGIKFDGVHLERTHRAGVTRLLTPPLTTGFFHGISALFRSGAKSVLDNGAITKANVAIHFTIGHDGKNPRTPSITSEVSTLRNLLTTESHLHPIYQAASNGKLPVVAHTNNKDVIAHLIALKRETGAHIVIAGGAEAHLIAPQLAAAQIPIIVAPFWGCEPLFFDGRHCLPGPPLTDMLGPQVLIRHGVKVAISNWDDTNNHVRNSAWEAGWVAGPGNRSLALDLVSRNIEESLMLPRTKDIVVYEGDPFEFGARVAVLFEEARVHSCYPGVD